MRKNSKNTEIDENSGEAAVEEKTLVFNPAGFIVKMVLSIAITVVMMMSGGSGEGLLIKIFNAVTSFALMYGVASLFGFVLKLSRNYIIAIILFLAAFFGLGYFQSTLDDTGKTIFGIVLLALLIAIIANDIRKAVLYFKYTV